MIQDSEELEFETGAHNNKIRYRINDRLNNGLCLHFWNVLKRKFPQMTLQKSNRFLNRKRLVLEVTISFIIAPSL